MVRCSSWRAVGATALAGLLGLACGSALAKQAGPAPVQTAAAQPATQPVKPPEDPLVVYQPRPKQKITLKTGTSMTISVTRPYRTLQIADPDVVDVVLMTNRTAILMPKAVGETNINIFDENMEATTIAIVVDDHPDFKAIEVHNKKDLGASTNFRCSGAECLQPPPPAAKAAMPKPPEQPAVKAASVDAPAPKQLRLPTEPDAGAPDADANAK